MSTHVPRTGAGAGRCQALSATSAGEADEGQRLEALRPVDSLRVCIPTEPRTPPESTAYHRGDSALWLRVGADGVRCRRPESVDRKEPPS